MLRWDSTVQVLNERVVVRRGAGRRRWRRERAEQRSELWEQELKDNYKEKEGECWDERSGRIRDAVREEGKVLPLPASPLLQEMELVFVFSDSSLTGAPRKDWEGFGAVSVCQLEGGRGGEDEQQVLQVLARPCTINFVLVWQGLWSNGMLLQAICGVIVGRRGWLVWSCSS